MWSWIAFGLAAWFALALMVSLAIGRAVRLAGQADAPGAHVVTTHPHPATASA